MRLVFLIVYLSSIISCTANKQQVNNSENLERATNYLIKSPAGIALTAEDVESTLRAAPPDAKYSILGNGENFMKFTTNQYISKQFIDYATKNKLDQDPHIVAKIRDYKNRLLSNSAVDHYVSLHEEPDFDDFAQERYLVNQSNYLAPEQLKISHILIRTGKKHSEDEAKLIATEVYEKAKLGNDFAALASEYSEDSSSAMGGDLGWVKKGQMIKPFENEAFSLQMAGDIGNIIKTKFGYHIIKLFDKKLERQLEFDEVKPQIIQELRAEHKKELQSQMLLKHDVNDETDVNKDAISALYVRIKKSMKKK